MKNTFLVFCLCVFYSFKVQALYGGKPINTAEFNSVVTLHLEDYSRPEYDFFCSGVLIAPNKVITAGHCIVGMSEEVYNDSHRLMYFPGNVEVSYKGKKIRSTSITLAPSYFEEIGVEGEDLALIELENNILNVKPVKIMKKSDLHLNMPLTMVARGRFANTQLKKAVMHTYSTVLYTNTKFSGICRGDSGGAMMSKRNGEWELAGILIYNGDEHCNRDINVSFFPKLQF